MINTGKLRRLLWNICDRDLDSDSVNKIFMSSEGSWVVGITMSTATGEEDEK